MGLPVVHFVEPGGRGGIFQHTAELARLLVAEGGQAVIHTAADCEALDFGEITICGCVAWHRSVRFRALRVVLITTSYLFATLPHLLRNTRGCVVHHQGLFKSPLYAIALWMLKWRAARTVFSPHNTFSREGRIWQSAVLKWSMRHADRVVCYSRFDAARIESWGLSPVVCPLVMWKPTVTAKEVADWRARLSLGSRAAIILIPGQIRADKGIDQMILAAPFVGVPFTLAVVGEDKGDLSRCRLLAERRGVDVVWVARYLSLRELAGAIAAADVVVLPYTVVSQSGVAALANELGTPTVAYPIGGLSELATVTAARCSPESLAESVLEVLTTRDTPRHEPLRASGIFRELYCQ